MNNKDFKIKPFTCRYIMGNEIGGIFLTDKRGYTSRYEYIYKSIDKSNDIFINEIIRNYKEDGLLYFKRF